MDMVEDRVGCQCLMLTIGVCLNCLEPGVLSCESFFIPAGVTSLALGSVDHPDLRER